MPPYTTALPTFGAGPAHAAPPPPYTPHAQQRSHSPIRMYDRSDDRFETHRSAEHTAFMQPRAERTRANVSKAYAYAAGGLGIAASTAAIAGQTALLAFPAATAITGCVGGIAGFLYSRTQAPNSTAQEISWALGCAGVGLMLTTLSALPAGLLVNAAIVTGALLGGLSLAAHLLPRDTVNAWAGPLLAALTGLCVLALAQMLLPASFTLASVVADRVQLYGGLAVFAGLFVVDSQALWEAADTDGPFSPSVESINIMMTAVNLFVRILQIMAEAQLNEQRRANGV